MPRLRLSKGHGLGNDYLVIDAAALPWPLTPPRIRAICDRHRGFGSDGILLADVAAHPFALRIYNPDGSEAEKSGNGLRIFAAWLYGRGHVGDRAFQVRLPKDTVTLQVMGALEGGALDIVADLGPADFRGEAAGFVPQRGIALGHELEVGDERLAVNPLSLGNPHCVVFVDALRRDEFERRGPLLATHAAFPAGTNVQFARPLADDRLEAWIWERGAGETLASGSSACAVAAAAVRLGLARAGEIRVSMPGGIALVTVSPEFQLRLRAPAQVIYDAEMTREMTEALGGL
jgi:diaminopimelate epimerase